MTRAERRRLQREADKAPQPPNFSDSIKIPLDVPDDIRIRAEEFGRVEYASDILRQHLPDNEIPIATRYDPRTDKVHVATASGRVYQLTRGVLDKGVPAIIGPDGRPFAERLETPTPPLPPWGQDILKSQDRLEKAWSQFQQEKVQDFIAEQFARAAEKRECRCVEEGEEGSPDAPPCKLHPNGDGKRKDQQPGGGEQPKPPKSTSLAEQWELAEARCEEWLAHTARSRHCECKADCGLSHKPYPQPESKQQLSHADGTVLLTPAYGRWSQDPGDDEGSPAVICDPCARAIVTQRPELLDWNPEE